MSTGISELFKGLGEMQAWVLLPMAAGAALWDSALAKGANHKYIKRVNAGVNPKTGKPRYRYYYNVASGYGVHHEQHMVVGSAFKHGEGHYHITKMHDDGSVTVRHDESGHETQLSREKLSTMLHDEHGAQLARYRGRLKVRSKRSGIAGHSARARLARFEKPGAKPKAAAPSGEIEAGQRATISGGHYFVGEKVKIVGPYAGGNLKGHWVVQRENGKDMAVRASHLTPDGAKPKADDERGPDTHAYARDKNGKRMKREGADMIPASKIEGDSAAHETLAAQWDRKAAVYERTGRGLEGTAAQKRAADVADFRKQAADHRREAAKRAVGDDAAETKAEHTGVSTHWKGDRAEYTGSTREMHGGTFHEVEIKDGHLKGKKKWTQKTPQPMTLAERAAEREHSQMMSDPKKQGTLNTAQMTHEEIADHIAAHLGNPERFASTHYEKNSETTIGRLHAHDIPLDGLKSAHMRGSYVQLKYDDGEIVHVKGKSKKRTLAQIRAEAAPKPKPEAKPKADADILAGHHKGDSDATQAMHSRAQELVPGIRRQDSDTVLAEHVHGGGIKPEFIERMIKENRIAPDKKDAARAAAPKPEAPKAGAKASHAQAAQTFKDKVHIHTHVDDVVERAAEAFEAHGSAKNDKLAAELKAHVKAQNVPHWPSPGAVINRAQHKAQNYLDDPKRQAKQGARAATIKTGHETIKRSAENNATLDAHDAHSKWESRVHNDLDKTKRDATRKHEGMGTDQWPSELHAWLGEHKDTLAANLRRGRVAGALQESAPTKTRVGRRKIGIPKEKIAAAQQAARELVMAAHAQPPRPTVEKPHERQVSIALNDGNEIAAKRIRHTSGAIADAIGMTAAQKSEMDGGHVLHHISRQLVHKPEASMQDVAEASKAHAMSNLTARASGPGDHSEVGHGDAATKASKLADAQAAALPALERIEKHTGLDSGAKAVRIAHEHNTKTAKRMQALHDLKTKMHKEKVARKHAENYTSAINPKKVAALKAKLEAHPGAKGPRKSAKGAKPKTHTKESAAKRLKTFASDDDTRPTLQHMNVQSHDGQTSAVATDGHRLAIVPVHETTERGMHHASKADLARGVTAESLKEQGVTYPDINRVIPKEDTGKQHHLDAEALTHLASLGASGPRHKVDGKMKQSGGNVVTFHVGDDGHAVAAAHHGAGGGKQGEIQGEHTSGRPNPNRAKGSKRDRIGISAKYLHDALKGSKGKVRVQITDPYSPVVIHREDGEKHVIMPMRL